MDWPLTLFSRYLVSSEWVKWNHDHASLLKIARKIWKMCLSTGGAESVSHSGSGSSKKSSFVSLRLRHPVKCLIFEIIVFLISCRSRILALYSSLVCRMWAWELLLFPLMITVCKKWTQRSRYTHLGGEGGGLFIRPETACQLLHRLSIFSHQHCHQIRYRFW